MLSFCMWYNMANTEVSNFSINHSCCKKIETFYSRQKEAKRVRVKGMDEYLDEEAKSSDGGDGSEDNDAGDDAVWSWRHPPKLPVAMIHSESFAQTSPDDQR